MKRIIGMLAALTCLLVICAGTAGLAETSAKAVNEPFSAEIPIERLLRQRSYYVYIPDMEGSDYAVKVAFFANETLNDVSYHAVSCDIREDGSLSLTEEGEFYHADRLTQDELFVACMEFPELLPNRVIVATDGSGETRIWGVQLSGEDGTPFLYEIEDEEYLSCLK